MFFIPVRIAGSTQQMLVLMFPIAVLHRLNQRFDSNLAEIFKSRVNRLFSSAQRSHCLRRRYNGYAHQLPTRLQHSWCGIHSQCIHWTKISEDRTESLHASPDEWYFTDQLWLSFLSETSTTGTCTVGALSITNQSWTSIFAHIDVRFIRTLLPTPLLMMFSLSLCSEKVNIMSITPVMIPVNILVNRQQYPKMNNDLTCHRRRRWIRWLSHR